MPPRRTYDLDVLRVFVAIAEHGSFSAAARALNRTQSAVSMIVKRLEAEAGLTLLDRGARRSRLNRHGEALLGYARRMLALNDEAMRTLGSARLEGEVRLGAMEDYAVVILPRLIARFARMHPQVHIRLDAGLTTPMLDRLGVDFDLVLAMHRAEDARGAVLRHERPRWAVGRRGDAASRTPLPLALAPAGCLFRDWALEALRSADRPWRLAYVSASLGAVEAAAAAGLAVTVVKPSTMPRALRTLGASTGLPALPTAAICLHRAQACSPAAGAFASFLETALGRRG